ncbi:carbohydrate kinase family protein [Gracilinema caldarium]|uniref:PfkB domain protein n=1 Tax=Gracilinema caldarium (strain ATCC 51460 / DSM 7334 / H1) TaxID=744872 RepID=F8EWR2_GRAC1|nr:carbohydrate kinase family protein [Gracilinema caldarium]AEJ18298.1 PfkB domain protein [Gracilinema caldarium DSM 7334]
MIIHGTGCCLIDYLYAKVDFSSPAFIAARSREAGDGGLSPGRLVFAEEFERFIVKPYQQALETITGGATPDRFNLGGPSVVALAHAAQMLAKPEYEVGFYGVCGTDNTAKLIETALEQLPFSLVKLTRKNGSTPRTDVLSDPSYDNGHGERTFINMIGSAAFFTPEDLQEDFFQADIITFGGTALVPPIHDALTDLLIRAKDKGALTFVNLVYDFRSELLHPNEKWKLGRYDDAYQYIDILVADREEALKTSGKPTIPEAIAYFLDRGTGSVVVTEGASHIHLASRRPHTLQYRTMPVCEKVNRELEEHPELRGDTTGCGDNFAGGLLANVAEQLTAVSSGKFNEYDLEEACIWANAAGGFTCFVIGGTYYEQSPGEKRSRILPYVTAYREQLSRTN